jgi:hypothetical protein
MALQFNEYLKGENGLASYLFVSAGFLWGSSTNACRIYIYPSTIALPSTCANSDVIPAGYILTYTLGTTSAMAIRNDAVSLGSSLTANTTAAGTLSWVFCSGSITTSLGAFITDSIGLTGASKLFTFSTLTPTSGQAVTLSNINIKFI